MLKQRFLNPTKLAIPVGVAVYLQEWLASADNPMTARVMVNRIWQYHFGRGIVRSSNDFGLQGMIPLIRTCLTGWLINSWNPVGILKRCTV